MDEHLQMAVRILLTYFFYLFERGFPRKDHPGNALFEHMARAGHTRHRGLGRGVYYNPGKLLQSKVYKTHVLHDNDICSVFIQHGHRAHGFCKLVILYEYV